MSWATCYSASNNIHFNFPPIMDDGRNYAHWQPGAVVSDRIRKQAGITSNYDYRKYMIENADEIIKYNQLEACDETSGNGSRYVTAEKTHGTPYVFKSVSDPGPMPSYGYENSDLKNNYLSRTELHTRLVTPVFTQAELLQQGYARAN